MTSGAEERSAVARQWLVELRDLLQKEGETNWRRGIEAAIAELSDPNGNVNPRGFDNARSIFRTMVSGGRGFAEYYIQKTSEVEQLEANRALDTLRSNLWSVFEG